MGTFHIQPVSENISTCAEASTSKYQRSTPTLDTLDVDVFHMIALELEAQGPGDSLKQLASSSRVLRALCTPVLFSRCRAWSNPDIPLSIRPFVRHLRYHMKYSEPQSVRSLERILERLPSLTAITFIERGSITWDALGVCFAMPNITSLALGPHVELLQTEEYASEESPPPPIKLSSFTYNTPYWRELHVREFLGPRRIRNRQISDLPGIYSREFACLSQLLPLMSESLRHLDLPMESAPLALMATLTWSKLRTLTICGRYHDAARVGLLPIFLSAIPQLSALSIQTFPCPHTEPAPILGRRHPSPRDVLCGLRSLTVAYPDPEDSIFSINCAILTHLSVRDCPRYYQRQGTRSLLAWNWPCPLLTPAECLSILSRMDMPALSSLELVYFVDAADEDDELLKYIAATYTRLSHLELHRYRRNRHQVVDYRHIATLLSELRSLQTIHLNLDFEKDHGAYCEDEERRCAWFPILRAECGPQILDIMQVCPYLQYVGLLYHHIPTAVWLEFHPPRCAAPRFVIKNDAAHQDSVCVPRRWCIGVSAATRYTPH